VRIDLMILPSLPIIWPTISGVAEISKTRVPSTSLEEMETASGVGTIPLTINSRVC